jgi:hypothetical protein
MLEHEERTVETRRDVDYINMTTIYIHLFGCVCLKTGTGGQDSRDPTMKCDRCNWKAMTDQ